MAWAQVNSSSRNLSVQLLPAFTIGNRTYSNVVEATGDTTNIKLTGLYKLYYAKDEGLVSYSEYPSLQTRVKQ